MVLSNFFALFCRKTSAVKSFDRLSTTANRSIILPLLLPSTHWKMMRLNPRKGNKNKNQAAANTGTAPAAATTPPVAIPNTTASTVAVSIPNANIPKVRIFKFQIPFLTSSSWHAVCRLRHKSHVQNCNALVSTKILIIACIDRVGPTFFETLMCITSHRASN